MDAKTLRASILQMAIEGKLVPQRDEEPAVEQIGEAPEEVPFEIPEKWKFVELGKAVDVRDGTHATPAYMPNGIPFVTSKNLKNGRIDFSNVKFISVADHLEFSKRSKVSPGDILFPMIGTVGNPVVVPCNSPEFSIKNMALLKNCPQSPIDFSFLFFLLKAFEERVNSLASGGVQKFVSLKFLRTFVVPLPPVDEQRRIVTRLNELLPLVDKFGKAQEALAVAQKEFPAKLKASLLQEAIQGKLVPQLDEEPAVEQIGEAPKDVPFAIPEKWKWIRLSDITSKISDGTHHSPVSNPIKTDSFPFLYITAKNIRTTGIETSSATFVSKKVHDEIYARCNPEYGDVLFIKDGATTGVVTQNTLRNPFSLLSSVALLKPSEHIDSSYLVHAMSSPEFNKAIRSSMAGTGIPRVTLKILKNILLPVPPISEQRRIVARLNELLPLVDRMVAQATADK